MRETINVTENNAMYTDLINKANNALSPENLRVVVRGEKNKKDAIQGIEKNGLTFYVAGEVPSDGQQLAIAFKGKPSREDIATARKNTIESARIGELMHVLFGCGSRIEDWDPNGDPMIILTNDKKYNGAGVILCDAVLKAVYRKIGEFYILPSSIHEVILVPANAVDPTALAAMVKTINATQVAEEEQLSDDVYVYNGKTWKLA